MARCLATAGARLSIIARDADQLSRAVADLSRRGARVVVAPGDVTDREQVKAAESAARSGNGPVDVLINNVGIILVGPVEEMREADYEQSLRTNFWATLFTTDEIVPEMKARGAGRIVNVASFGGKVAVPNLLPYSAGKFALVGFSNGLRAELARHGIVVTTVSAGLLRTGSHVNAEFKGRYEEEYAWFALGGGLPGLSMSAETAARKILSACARGDAEAILGLPAKVAVVAQALCPNLTAAVLALVGHLPRPWP